MPTIIYCDGGCHGNGTANATTYGSFSVNGQIHRVPLNGRTNNEAEYLTLIEALEYCKLHQIASAQIYMDSQLVVNQVAGGWRVTAPRLADLNRRARQLWRQVHAGLAWVPRETIVAQLGH